MCTVSLRCGNDSVLLTMNRDELYERAPEQPPRLIPGDHGRPSWLAPFDGASGGTWIGVNDRGVVSCILNGYDPVDVAPRDAYAIPSRGSIIPRILEGQEGRGAARLQDTLDFSAYASFTLLVASREGGEILRWRRGTEMTREPVAQGWTFLTSSSWSEPEVARWRRSAFDAWIRAGERNDHGLPVWQVTADAEDASRAPFMTREKSGTRSVTQIRVDRARATLTWWPRAATAPIDPSRPGASVELPLMR